MRILLNLLQVSKAPSWLRIDHSSQVDGRAPTPEAVLVKPSQENLGPSEEADAEFAKELAKLVTESSAESKRVDRKTALALWESTVIPGGKKKRQDGAEDDGDLGTSPTDEQVMKFTLITKKGKQQQVRHH
jgi:regulator of nonsense transcripts 2